MFCDDLERLRGKNPGKYAFILKGGKAYIDALYYLLKTVLATEKIPEG